MGSGARLYGLDSPACALLHICRVIARQRNGTKAHRSHVEQSVISAALAFHAEWIPPGGFPRRAIAWRVGRLCGTQRLGIAAEAR